MKALPLAFHFTWAWMFHRHIRRNPDLTQAKSPKTTNGWENSFIREAMVVEPTELTTELQQCSMSGRNHRVYELQPTLPRIKLLFSLTNLKKLRNIYHLRALSKQWWCLAPHKLELIISQHAPGRIAIAIVNISKFSVPIDKTCSPKPPSTIP